MKVYESRSEILKDIPQCGVACEVGVFALDYSRQIASVCRPARLTLIDPFVGDVLSGDEHAGNIRVFAGDELFRAALDFAEQTPGVEVVRGYSPAAIWMLEGPYDFIYIDGDHSYHTCRDDLDAAWRKLSPGGFLAGHDYTINPDKVVDPEPYRWFGVKRAVDEFLSQKGVELHGLAMDGYTSFVVRKPC